LPSMRSRRAIPVCEWLSRCKSTCGWAAGAGRQHPRELRSADLRCFSTSGWRETSSAAFQYPHRSEERSEQRYCCRVRIILHDGRCSAKSGRPTGTPLEQVADDVYVIWRVCKRLLPLCYKVHAPRTVVYQVRAHCTLRGPVHHRHILLTGFFSPSLGMQ
jgi:hypothetical protein